MGSMLDLNKFGWVYKAPQMRRMSFDAPAGSASARPPAKRKMSFDAPKPATTQSQPASSPMSSTTPKAPSGQWEKAPKAAGKERKLTGYKPDPENPQRQKPIYEYREAGQKDDKSSAGEEKGGLSKQDAAKIHAESSRIGKLLQQALTDRSKSNRLAFFRQIGTALDRLQADYGSQSGIKNLVQEVKGNITRLTSSELRPQYKMNPGQLRNVSDSVQRGLQSLRNLDVGAGKPQKSLEILLDISKTLVDMTELFKSFDSLSIYC